MHGGTKHEMRCTSTVGKHVRSKKHEIQSMNVRYTCMLDTRHERNAHAVKQKQRRKAETGAEYGGGSEKREMRKRVGVR